MIRGIVKLLLMDPSTGIRYNSMQHKKAKYESENRFTAEAYICRCLC